MDATYAISMVPKYRKEAFCRLKPAFCPRNLCRRKGQMLRKPEFVSVMAVCFPRCVRIFGYGFSKVRAVHERRGNADFKRRGGRWGTVWYVGALGKNIRKITEYTRSRLKEDAMPIQLIISLVPLYDEPGSFRPVAPRAASLVPLPLYGEPGSLRPVRPFKAVADTVSFISVYEGLPVGPQIFCGGKIPGRAGGFLLGRAGLSEFYAFLT